ncbi:CMP-N-acetylneuraminic acid synthetase [Paenibacillus sp. PK3_47]|uniref:acylneuraminate cytidylyltransferase family protein n=1 Tax=Paenibacillus sp. PK3_47 TaxID=2072642 RepID=UPI00201DC489|nr:acylneuraminate cytidylyltransferase family protein [Paenibacillus sp. PK3_47]UQZ33843.1 CMP-N-acetylneuraminic acid synthetase [Paenibacillus sp. PK3_47]
MRILFTICGRAGSKGIKNKNLKDFLGYPLVFYTASVIDLFMKQNSRVDCDIVVNTDSKDLMNLIHQNLKLQIDFIDRDPALGQDYTPKIAVIQNSLEIMEERNKQNYDMVVDLDITSPLRTVADLQSLIDKKTECNADVVFSVTDSRRNPYFNMVKQSAEGYVRVIESSFNARQEAPEIFDMNASLYAYSPSFLRSGKGIFEGRCEVIRMMDTAVLDIDNENDFELMEVIAEYLFRSYEEMDIVRRNISEVTKI